MRSFEAAAGRRRRLRTLEVRADAAPRGRGIRARSASRRCGRAEFRVRTACLWLVWFCVNFSYYGAFIWIPSILVRRGTTSCAPSASR